MSGYHARIRVRVFRERGALLARFAHDLELELAASRLQVSGDRVDVHFDLGTLKVLGALTEDGVDASSLDESARAQILSNARNDVLEVQRFPNARFQGTFAAAEQVVHVGGELELHGRRRPVDFVLTREANTESRFSGQLTISPSRWEIAPYRALLGTLKLQDRADLTITVSIQGAGGA